MLLKFPLLIECMVRTGVKKIKRKPHWTWDIYLCHPVNGFYFKNKLKFKLLAQFDDKSVTKFCYDTLIRKSNSKLLSLVRVEVGGGYPKIIILKFLVLQKYMVVIGHFLFYGYIMLQACWKRGYKVQSPNVR